MSSESKLSDTPQLDFPVRAYELCDINWTRPRLQPVLVCRETAFKYKIRRYETHYSYTPGVPDSFRLSTQFNYVDKRYIFLSWEEAHARLVEVHKTRLTNAQRAVDIAQAALREAQLTPEPVFPDIPDTSVALACSAASTGS